METEHSWLDDGWEGINEFDEVIVIINTQW
jgi:hypothetical protein